MSQLYQPFELLLAFLSESDKYFALFKLKYAEYNLYVCYALEQLMTANSGKTEPK